MELSEKQRRFPQLVAELIRFAYDSGFELTFGEAYRTEEQQRVYVREGRSKTMASRHRDRLAIDFNLFKDGDYITNGEAYRALGEKWEALGGNWGGRFGVRACDYDVKTGWDANHFEYWP
ncbi:MAG TPA: hypothetical protein DDW94_05285 [Deltaproteobacteria bacterium]|nr:MAG: hypothetical protein A2Z79_04670 [Deltaproteobacteria bacterium GWA2_55_82]OGQ61974.1 MAG: hypothetical protein A3I81_13195 [Deltaproteobacteria bacterium RIFCSPLOWO2_02_FULL_55_12]OIJ74669.1 MAG: hypothetical protein A2V21_310580 [Deltaproteobacteria bacterium GWC2_55_46]HBG46387.1 hypothetical protein [Deltaproteobacteria bacterium]HCY10598.1 hypothetical protein [Deltaproteobacteria bacterium]